MVACQGLIGLASMFQMEARWTTIPEPENSEPFVHALQLNSPKLSLPPELASPPVRTNPRLVGGPKPESSVVKPRAVSYLRFEGS